MQCCLCPNHRASRCCRVRQLTYCCRVYGHAGKVTFHNASLDDQVTDCCRVSTASLTVTVVPSAGTRGGGLAQSARELLPWLFALAPVIQQLTAAERHLTCCRNVALAPVIEYY